MDIIRCPPNVQLGNFLKCPTTIGEVKGRSVRGVGRICGQGHGQGQGGLLCEARGAKFLSAREEKRGGRTRGGKEGRGGPECGKIDPGQLVIVADLFPSEDVVDVTWLPSGSLKSLKICKRIRQLHVAPVRISSPQHSFSRFLQASQTLSDSVCFSSSNSWD
jgi:hypothetical protein